MRERGANRSGGLVGGRAGGLRLNLVGWPGGLCVDALQAHSAALTPRAGNRARAAAEVRDHLTGAAAGHTLPRLMGRVPAIIHVVCAVVSLAGHVRIRLAFPA